MPAVYVGTPQNTSEYELSEINGIKVYVSPFISTEKDLRVFTSGFAFLKGLKVAPVTS